MTDFFDVSTKNDIDSISIDIDVNPMFQWPTFLLDDHHIGQKTGRRRPGAGF
jgi:hypothetical protein